MLTSDKIKNIFTDTIWSMAGLVLMNVAAQFVVYPFWRSTLGSETYGNIVYQLAILNILAVSVGSGINYTRMKQSAERETGNRPYLIMMLAGMVLSTLVLIFLYAIGLVQSSIRDFCLFCVLTVVTMWRYYADVEYRLRINYKGFFFFYLVIGIGYLLGIWLFKLTGIWPLALLPGECAGLLVVLLRGSIFKADGVRGNQKMGPIIHIAAILIGTNVISYLIFNGDRIILQLFAGSTAVTIYYIASLFGKTMTFISTPLNGVLIGHLAKYDGKLTRELMNQVTTASLAGILVMIVVCQIASVIILPFLYPSDYQDVKSYLLLANAAQIIYFTGNILTTSVLLRFTSAANQMIVNVVHGALFVFFCIPVVMKFGIEGFCWGLLAANTVRVIICLVIGYKNTMTP